MISYVISYLNRASNHPSCDGYPNPSSLGIRIPKLSYQAMTPQTRGVRLLPVNPRNNHECLVTRHFSRKSGRVSFVRGAIPKYNTGIYLFQTVQYIHHMRKTATWPINNAHNNIPTIYSIVLRVQMFLLLYNTYIKIGNFQSCIHRKPKAQPGFLHKLGL